MSTGVKKHRGLNPKQSSLWRAAEADERRAALARLSATVDPAVLQEAKAIADATGFRNSFSAYLNQVLDRDNKKQAFLLSNGRP